MCSSRVIVNEIGTLFERLIYFLAFYSTIQFDLSLFVKLSYHILTGSCHSFCSLGATEGLHTRPKGEGVECAIRTWDKTKL